jgi:hypothetical protein
MFRAALAAHLPLTRMRWLAYGFGALIIPRSGFVRFVAWPMPEPVFEAFRRVRELFQRRQRNHVNKLR